MHRAGAEWRAEDASLGDRSLTQAPLGQPVAVLALELTTF